MEGWMDENFIKNIFQTVLAENVQVKVIRDRNSGYVLFLALDLPACLAVIPLLVVFLQSLPIPSIPLALRGSLGLSGDSRIVGQLLLCLVRASLNVLPLTRPTDRQQCGLLLH